jgi:hypothetical protein
MAMLGETPSSLQVLRCQWRSNVQSKGGGKVPIIATLRLILFCKREPLSKCCVKGRMCPRWNIHKLQYGCFAMGNRNFRAELCKDDTHSSANYYRAHWNSNEPISTLGLPNAYVISFSFRRHSLSWCSLHQDEGDFARIFRRVETWYSGCDRRWICMWTLCSTIHAWWLAGFKNWVDLFIEHLQWQVNA